MVYTKIWHRQSGFGFFDWGKGMLFKIINAATGIPVKLTATCVYLVAQTMVTIMWRKSSYTYISSWQISAADLKVLQLVSVKFITLSVAEEQWHKHFSKENYVQYHCKYLVKYYLIQHTL